MTCHSIRQVAASCNVACSSGIMTVNSSGGSTLQCGRWLWDNMPLNSSKHPPYLNSTSDFDFGHITAVDMSFCTSEIVSKSDHPREKKYRHVETIALNCLVLRKSRFCILATDRQTNRWTGPLHEAALAVASGGLKTR